MKKITEIKFPARSRFLEPCKKVLRQHRNVLLSGLPITVHLSKRGFNRHAIVSIDPKDPNFFWIDKKSEPSWFSARIRAAALALHELGHFGQFDISHFDGILTIQYLGENCISK